MRVHAAPHVLLPDALGREQGRHPGPNLAGTVDVRQGRGGLGRPPPLQLLIGRQHATQRP